MKLPEFNLKEASWDRFKAFYIDRGPGTKWSGNRPIIQFDTGEVIITPHNWTPDNRGKFTDLNIGVFRFADRHCLTMTTAEGEPLPTAHLDHKGNHRRVVVDYDTGHVVSLCHMEKETRIPVRLRQAAMCYFSGAGQEPVGGPIIQSRPRKLPKDQREHLDGLIQACRAWAKLGDKQLPVYGMTLTYDGLLEASFDELSEEERGRIAQRGINVTRELVEHAYLLIK